MALQGLKPADITGAIIANVVPAAAYNLATLCTEFFKVAPMVIGDPEVDIGIEVRMDHRENVGADRLVNALAAHRAHGRSEEHTSELQSLMRISYAVFCLKKKKNPDK